MISNKDWYLVYTKPRNEVLAIENLNRQGYFTYLPMGRVIKRIKSKKHSQDLPLFPRYLFINLDINLDNWSPIRSTVGVSHVVRFGPLMAKVPNNFIQLLKTREQEDAYPIDQTERFTKGEKLRVSEGPFAGYEGIFEASKGEDRAIILLDIANNYTKLTIEKDALDKQK